MADVTLSLSASQAKALQRMDANQTAKAVLQAHVDTWLLPFVQALTTEDRETVREAYITADPLVQAQVRELLNLA